METQRAEMERQTAEMERQRAEQMAAYLRSLGIDPENIVRFCIVKYSQT
jgi:hypothetical protein